VMPVGAKLLQGDLLLYRSEHPWHQPSQNATRAKFEEPDT
jgi:hypothetical protein